MAFWLLKTEPSEYSYDDLERERETAWDGVANPVALKHARAMRPGELAIVYHTGKERRAVGVAEVRAAGDEPRVAPRGRLVEPVGLDAIKKMPIFASSPLVRMGRLSVVPLEDKQWKALLALAKTKL
jgi:predicted RNA-binding protein with PUA-like domain